MSDITTVETEANDDWVETEVKKFYYETYWRPNKNDMFNSLEDVREKVQTEIKKNPFRTEPYYIMEVKEIMRSRPVAETQIESVEVDGWLKAKLENKDNE